MQQRCAAVGVLLRQSSSLCAQDATTIRLADQERLAVMLVSPPRAFSVSRAAATEKAYLCRCITSLLGQTKRTTPLSSLLLCVLTTRRIIITRGRGVRMNDTARAGTLSFLPKERTFVCLQQSRTGTFGPIKRLRYSYSNSTNSGILPPRIHRGSENVTQIDSVPFG